MRLFDADVLLAEVAECKTKQNSMNQDYVTGYLSAMSTVEGMIASTDAVEAIPIEWLAQKRDNETFSVLMNIYGRGDKDLIHSIHKVLELWRKEQE